MSYCSNCIHYKVCGNEGVDDSAMTFCADKQTDGDLISRQAVLDIVEFECGEWIGLAKTIVKAIEQLPSAEKTAEWIFKTTKSAKCSKCGYIQFTNAEDRTRNVLIHKAVYHYCPNCGARMKQKSEEEK